MSESQQQTPCLHEDSLWGRCVSCGKPWDAQQTIRIDGMSSFICCHRCGAYHDQREACPRCGR